MLFLSPRAEQSAYWARQLGFGRGEWRHISSVAQVYSYRDTLVYLVGTWYESCFVDQALERFAAAGVECILAEEMVPLATGR